MPETWRTTTAICDSHLTAGSHDSAILRRFNEKGEIGGKNLGQGPNGWVDVGGGATLLGIYGGKFPIVVKRLREFAIFKSLDVMAITA